MGYNEAILATAKLKGAKFAARVTGRVSTSAAFMQEHGPHFPDPSEPLAIPEAPLSWWDSMGVVGPYGPTFSTHWNNALVLNLFIRLLFPVTRPLLLLWGTGNYLSFKTEIPVDWPAIVKERIGAPMPG